MKHQLKTIREALELATDGPIVDRDGLMREALTALSELERMAGEQKPVARVDGEGQVAWFAPIPEDGANLYATPPAQQPHDHVAVTWDKDRTRILAVTLQDADGRVLCVIDEAPAQQQYEAGDMASAAAQGFRDGVASVAQQPHEIEVQCPVCNHKFYEWPGEHKVQQPQADIIKRQANKIAELTADRDGWIEAHARLHREYHDFRKAAPQQAEAVHRYVLELPDGDKRKAKVFWNERNEANGEITHHLCISVDAAPQQSQAEPFGYVSQHTNGSWEFSPTPAGVYPDTAKSITAVYTKQPQAECRSDGRCQYAIDHGAEGLGHCPEGKCAMKQPQVEGAEVFYCKTCGTAMQMPHDDCLACERGESQQSQAEKRCEYCDGTGDVHSIDGQWRGECQCQKQPQAEAVPEMHDALCPALTGGDCTCTPPATIDKVWAQFCGGIGRGPDAPYPGMIEAFESHYGQTFTDKDWREETGVWAAAWKAAKAHGEAAPQQAEAVPSDVVRDAERYRWLRNESWAGYNTGKGTPSVYTVDGAGNRRMMLAEEAMDAAIDAVIAAQGEKPCVI